MNQETVRKRSMQKSLDTLLQNILDMLSFRYPMKYNEDNNKSEFFRQSIEGGGQMLNGLQRCNRNI